MKIFALQNFFGQQKILYEKNYGRQKFQFKMFRPKKIFVKKIFGQKIFWQENFLVNQTFQLMKFW